MNHGAQETQSETFVPSELDIEADKLSSDVHSSIVRAIDSTYSIPIAEHVFYSSFESYDNLMKQQQKTLDDMMSRLSTCTQRPYYQSETYKGTTYYQQQNVGSDYGAVDDLIDKYDMIREFSEQMFDRIGQNLDDASGLTSHDAHIVQATLSAANHNKLYASSQNQNKSSTSSQPISKSIHQLHRSQSTTNYLGRQHFSLPGQRFHASANKNIPRPQQFFKDRVDNSYRPFEPSIREKPNACVPLQLDLQRDEQDNEHYAHPYEYEIMHFQIKPDVLITREPIAPPELTSTPIEWIDDIPSLENMCQHIESQKEFAVDVEHHSYRTFQGITCLLQISTRTRDFVIDAIKLRGELYRLNQSFTNSNIVKVFHGADCDILWLQRDFGVYVVNLFDTSRAAKYMKFAHLSLSFLMKHYCNHEPDKSYQLADWRERPLPLPMIQYARADTHYLLYIHDRLRNDLLAKQSGIDLLKSVYERGRDICLKRYEKPPFSETSHLSVLKKSRSTFNSKQMYAFKELYKWRDRISRELDESVGYVLPNGLMIRIAEYLPREPQGITALCNPVPPTVKKYLSDIHAIILQALDVPLDETSKLMTGHPLGVDPALRSVDLDGMNHKQDIGHSLGVMENRVPNLLDKMYKLNCSNDDTSNWRQNGKNRRNLNSNPSRLYNFLDANCNNKSRKGLDVLTNDSVTKKFVSPFRRYEARHK